MNIYQLLRQDHQMVTELFDELEGTRAGTGRREELMRELELALIPHARAESEYFYPMLAADSEMRERMEDAEMEHHVVEALLGEAQEVIDDDEQFLAKLELLRTSLENHVREEEGEIFRRAKEIIDEVQADALLGEMMATKEEVAASLLGEVPRRRRVRGEEAFGAPAGR